jgi:hypothetical protein
LSSVSGRKIVIGEAYTDDAAPSIGGMEAVDFSAIADAHPVKLALWRLRVPEAGRQGAPENDQLRGVSRPLHSHRGLLERLLLVMFVWSACGWEGRRRFRQPAVVVW